MKIISSMGIVLYKRERKTNTNGFILRKGPQPSCVNLPLHCGFHWIQSDFTFIDDI